MSLKDYIHLSQISIEIAKDNIEYCFQWLNKIDNPLLLHKIELARKRCEEALKILEKLEKENT